VTEFKPAVTTQL